MEDPHSIPGSDKLHNLTYRQGSFCPPMVSATNESYELLIGLLDAMDRGVHGEDEFTDAVHIFYSTSYQQLIAELEVAKEYAERHPASASARQALEQLIERSKTHILQDLHLLEMAHHQLGQVMRLVHRNWPRLVISTSGE